MRAMTDRGYARISLDTEESGSIDKQKGRIEEAGTEVEWYIDRSVSGSKIPFDERPDGMRLLADLQRGDRVLITKIDRAARSVSDLLRLVTLIDERGASIKFVDQPFIDTDRSNPFARFILTLLAAIAELEANIIAERRRESLTAFRAEGRHAVGAAPYGFESVPNPNGRGLVIRPHPIEGPLLREAIAKVIKGASRESIAKELGLGRTHLTRVLQNPRLAGMTPHNGGVVMINGVPRVDPEAALISMTEFNRLQETGRQQKGWNRHNGIGPALTCSGCGDRLYYQRSARKPEYATYQCRLVSDKHKVEKIPSASVMARNAEEYVERTFLATFGHLPHMVTYWEDSDSARTEAISLARVALDQIRREQDEAETEAEEDALEERARAARKALREAKALPSNRRLVTVPSGRQIKDEWVEADAATRVLMLKAHGEWVVQPGRKPIDQKIIVRERLVDMGKVRDALTPLS